MMLQKDLPDDFVMGTVESHTVRDFVEAAFHSICMNIQWKGSGVNEVGISDEDRTFVEVSREFFSPLESDNYRADYAKEKEKLG